MRKQALIVAAVAALIVGAAVLLVSRIDSESIGKELVRQANAIDGVELSVTDFDLGIFSGLRLGKTKATLDMPSGRVDAELESLTVQVTPVKVTVLGQDLKEPIALFVLA